MSSRSPIGHASIPSCEERWRIDASHFARLVQPQLCRRCSSPTVACASQCPTVTLPSKGDGSGDGTCLESPACVRRLLRAAPLLLASCPCRQRLGGRLLPPTSSLIRTWVRFEPGCPTPSPRHLARAVPRVQSPAHLPQPSRQRLPPPPPRRCCSFQCRLRHRRHRRHRRHPDWSPTHHRVPIGMIMTTDRPALVPVVRPMGTRLT